MIVVSLRSVSLSVSVIKLFRSLRSLSFFGHFRPLAPRTLKGQKLLAQGTRPGLLWMQACRPERAKAFNYQAIYKAFALTGRIADCYYTQGDALGLGASALSGRAASGAFGSSARTASGAFGPSARAASGAFGPSAVLEPHTKNLTSNNEKNCSWQTPTAVPLYIIMCFY